VSFAGTGLHDDRGMTSRLNYVHGGPDAVCAMNALEAQAEKTSSRSRWSSCYGRAFPTWPSTRGIVSPSDSEWRRSATSSTITSSFWTPTYPRSRSRAPSGSSEAAAADAALAVGLPAASHRESPAISRRSAAAGRKPRAVDRIPKAADWNPTTFDTLPRAADANPTWFDSTPTLFDWMPAMFRRNHEGAGLEHDDGEPGEVGSQSDADGVRRDEARVESDPVGVEPDAFGVESDALGLEPDPIEFRSAPSGVEPNEVEVGPNHARVGLADVEVGPNILLVRPNPFGGEPKQLGVGSDDVGIQSTDRRFSSSASRGRLCLSLLRFETAVFSNRSG